MSRTTAVPAILVALLMCLCAMACHADGTRIITGITPSGIDFDGRYVAWVEQGGTASLPDNKLQVYDFWKDITQTVAQGVIWLPAVGSGKILWSQTEIEQTRTIMWDMATSTHFWPGLYPGGGQAATDGIRVVCVGDGLVMYDLTVDSDGDGVPNWQEFPLLNPDPARTQIAPPKASSYFSPAIDGRWIAWIDYSGPTSVMYVYDRALSQAFPFLTSAPISGPSISGDTIVWSDTSSGNDEVYAYDLALDSDSDGIPNWREDPRPDPDPALRNLSADPAAQYNPTIGGNLVLWTDERYGGTDIMLYDLASSTRTELTHDTYPQWAIHVANGVAAWTDGRSGSTYDVYVWGDPSVWASLSGTVFDAHTGLPIPGATVTDGKIVRTSLADGTYNMPVVPSGPQTVQATATGYLATSFDVTLAAGEHRPLNLPLVPVTYGGISGIVTDSDTSLPVAGATVTCGPATATSDAGGLYVLAVTPGAGLTVSVTASGYHPKSISGVSVTADQMVALDIALDPLPKGAIAGTVRAADTLAPVGGATVSCAFFSATTASDGTYTLSDVPEGTGYSVTAAAPGFYANGQLGVSVTGGQTTIVDITLPPIVGSIAGTVTDATTKLPIGGATVACGSADATTNVRGDYDLPGVRVGNGYTVTASAAAHSLSSASGIAVAAGETTQVDFTLTSTASGSIAGRVTDASSGLPIRNGHVSCGALSATTGADGAYALNNVPAGSGYRVGASAGGYKWASATGIAVGSGQTTPQDFALARLPSTEARFEEMLGGPIPSAAGVGWGDYDGDGYPDLLVAGATAGTGVPVAHGPLLYHNDHDLSFAEANQSANLDATPIEQWGVAWGDYDNDGDLDLLVGSGAGYPMLYRRDATQFIELGQSAGFHVEFSAGRGVTWCDFNGDSLLDAFCSNIFGKGYLMLNDGDGTFSEVGASAGMTGDAWNDAAHSASWGDYNNDGLPDLVLARLAKPTRLYRNNGNSTFADVSDESGVSAFVDAHSAIWGDYDNDGWLDCYVTSASYVEPQGDRDALFHNNHDGTFTDVSDSVGMAADVYVAGGAAWLDYDNDGYLDLYVGNWGEQPFLYRNDGDGTFTNVVAGSGLEVPWGSYPYQAGGAASADMDLDGRTDLIQAYFATSTDNDGSRLFHNIGPAGSWLRVRALTSGSGDATGSGPVRDAIGARVDVNVDNDSNFPLGRTLTRLIDGGSGFCAQNEQIAQFGIPTDGPVAVRVRFPDGTVVIHYGIEVNQAIVVADVAAGLAEDSFTDAGYTCWAYDAIEAVVESDIVLGYPDGTYHPEDAVSRDQMAVYISRALAGGDASVPAGPATATFSDVPTGQWAYRYVEYAVSHDIVQGYDATHYRPEVEVDRGQMAVFVARSQGWVAIGDDMTTAPDLFPDVLAGFWAGTAIQACVDHAVVQGYPDGHYQPGWKVTRDQMAVYIARAFQLPM